MSSLISAAKLLLGNRQQILRQNSNGLHTALQTLLFRSTPILYAEPLKKKKKLDPQVIKQREERKRKKIEKQIRRLEKNARQLKPIDELEVPLNLLDEQKIRKRDISALSDAEVERRAILNKKWASYRMNEQLHDFKLLDQIVSAQAKALQELRFESEELYQYSIQPAIHLLPFTTTGPVHNPPKISTNYESPDGDFLDISKKWE